MSKIDIESMKSYIGQEMSWADEDGESIGIVIDISEDGEALVKKCVDLEGIEETEETVIIAVEELKLRTFVVVEKADEGLAQDKIVSWETSNGMYYGDIVSMATEGSVRGEPQGLEIEASEERPAYVIRVWMWDEDEWMPTNVTVVAYGDALTPVEELPEPMEEEPEDEEMEDSESMVMEDGEKNMSIENAISEIVAREVAKALAALNTTEAKSEEVVVETKSDEADAAAEVVEAEATPAAEEAVAEEAVVEEAPAAEEAVVSEEAVAEVAAEEVAEEVKSEEAVVEKATLTYDDLKELNELFKVL